MCGGMKRMAEGFRSEERIQGREQGILVECKVREGI